MLDWLWEFPALGAPAFGFGVEVLFSYSGTFTLTTPKAAVLRGGVSGSIGGGIANPACAANETAAPLDFTLTVAEATAGFQRATGSIRLFGTWCSRAGFPTPILGGPIVGALEGNVRR